MARHYSPISFFRNAPNKLLKVYFDKHELLSEIDFDSMKEGNPKQLIAAWADVSEEDKKEIEADFLEIFTLSCEKGVKTIIDEATFHDPEGLNDFTEWLASKKNHYEKVFATFLEHPRLWKGAALFFHADTLPYWRKRKNFPTKPAQCGKDALDQLSKLIADYFHYTEGKGKHCFVDPLRRNDLDYFFAYPEDYSQRSNEWVSGLFGPRPHNPAFEIIFAYSELEGTLDINYVGNFKAIEPLQAFFAGAILSVEKLAPEPDDNRIYDLNPLIDKDFNFSYSANSVIQYIRVKKFRLSSKVNKGELIILVEEYKSDEKEVYQLLEKLSPCFGY